MALAYILDNAVNALTAFFDKVVYNPLDVLTTAQLCHIPNQDLQLIHIHFVNMECLCITVQSLKITPFVSEYLCTEADIDM